MSLFEKGDGGKEAAPLEFPTEPAFLVPVEVRETPRLGRGHKGVFALTKIPAHTKFWAWTDRVHKIHHSELEAYIRQTFGDDNDNLEAIQLFLRQGFGVPRPTTRQADSAAADSSHGGGDCAPDDYFYTNPADAGRFMNHSCQANCGPDGTLRSVEAGEELTMDYAFHGDPQWYREICAKYGVLTEAQVAAAAARR